MKVIETMDILSVIKEVKEQNDSNLNEIYLRAKDSITGEVKGIESKYIADEILFLFLSEREENMSLQHYLLCLERESYDNCWNSYVEIPEGYTHPDDITDDAIDCLSLSEEEMNTERYAVVTGLETRAYFGSHNDCPIKEFKKTALFKEIEVCDNFITLIY